MRVLVLGAGGPMGVNFARSINLANNDILLYGTDINRYNLELAMGHYAFCFLVPEDEESKIDAIQNIIEDKRIDFIYAQAEPEVLFLSKNRKKFKVKYFLPKHKIIETCQSKWETSIAWYDVWPQTKSYILINDNALIDKIRIVRREFGNKFWLRAASGGGGRASLLAKNIWHAYYWCEFWKQHANISLIAQKYLPGRNFAWQSIWKNGKLIVSQGRERLQYIYPHLTISGITGTPSVARTVNIDKLNENAIKAVKLIDKKPHGIYSVDLTGDGDDIVPTEINAGRFFTTSFFLAKAGEVVGESRGNIPLMYLRLGNDLEILDGKDRDILPDNIHWFRHIDCGERLVLDY